MKLNLGACDRAFPGFLSVDIVPPTDIVADLSQPWPWETDSVEEVVAHDVIEHIGDCNHINQVCEICRRSGGDVLEATLRAMSKVRHSDGRIHFMNELHRVMKAGSRATIETPNASRGAGFFQDPTHKAPWCMNSFQYFEDGSFAVQRLAKSYGITARFKVLSLGESSYKDRYEEVWKITAVLECVK